MATASAISESQPVLQNIMFHHFSTSGPRFRHGQHSSELHFQQQPHRAQACLPQGPEHHQAPQHCTDPESAMDPLLTPWTQPRPPASNIDRFIADERATPGVFTLGANLEPAQTAHYVPEPNPAWSAQSQSQNARAYQWDANSFNVPDYAQSQSSRDDVHSYGYGQECEGYDSYPDLSSMHHHHFPRIYPEEEIRGLGDRFTSMSELAGQRPPEEVNGSPGEDGDELDLEREVGSHREAQNWDPVDTLNPSNDHSSTIPGFFTGPSLTHGRSISDIGGLAAPSTPLGASSSPPSNLPPTPRSTTSSNSSRRHRRSNKPPQPAKRPARGRRGGRGSTTPSFSHRRPLATSRPFLCTFLFAGCTRQFSSKNEWKRHVSTQHMQLAIWRCDDASCADSRNASFNRKDLFGQHVKRRHCPKTFAPSSSSFSPSASAASSLSSSPSSSLRRMMPGEQELEKLKKTWWGNEVPKIQERCKIKLRSPPERSTCGFCGRVFEGENSWDARMEHVGHHYEAGGDVGKEAWKSDWELVDWAVGNGLVKKRLPAADGEAEYELVESGKELCVRSGRADG